MGVVDLEDGIEGMSPFSVIMLLKKNPKKKKKWNVVPPVIYSAFPFI